jgi:cell division transport system permease protein
MSASYDRPGSRTLPPPHPGVGSQPAAGYADPVMWPPNGPLPSRRERRASDRSAPDPAKAAIVPADCVTGRSLTLVISIMCFFACLTAGAAYMTNQSAAAWLKDIASEVTVQIEPREKVETENTVREVATFLNGHIGVRHARPLSLEDSAALLEPWLGQSDALKTLPVPRLIALELDRGSPPDLTALRAALEKQFKAVTLDDHRHWQQQIRTVARSFALGGLAILTLVAAATTAIVVSATRSAIASNREIVEVLHFVGATDRFIAREFAKHFLNLGIRAGLVGAISATLVFLGLPMGMEVLGGGTMSLVELRQIVGAGTLDAPGHLLLGIVVIVIAGMCMLTSRFSVYRILHSRP